MADTGTTAFLSAVKAGDLDRVRQMLAENADLLFAEDDHYGSPVRAATDLHPGVADYLARVELVRIREGSVPPNKLYGAIHDLGEAAHSTTGYAGCERFRTEAEPTIAGFLDHREPQLRYIALNVLSFHWDLKPYVETFLWVASTDPAEDVRDMALSGAAYLARGSQHPKVTRALLAVLRDPTKDATARKSGYNDLREVWEGFDAAFRIYQLTLGKELALRDAAKERGDLESELEDARQRLWDESIDWGFVESVERKLEEITPK